MGRAGLSLSFFIVVTAAVLFGAGCFSERDRSDERAAAGEPVAAEATAASSGSVYEGVLSPGETPMGWVLRRDVERNEALALIGAITPSLPPSRFRTDDTLRLARDGAGDVVRFEVERRNSDLFIVERGDSGEWVARREGKVFRREVVRFSGVIENSLWASITGRGASPELVVLFADIFQWTFDFLTDCRRGDRFEFLVEALYDGEKFHGYGPILVARYEGALGTVEGVRYRLANGKAAYFSSDGQSLQKIFLKSPLNYRRISSRFTTRRYHPILKKFRPHLGIDYAAAPGTPIVSIGDGVVVKKGWNGGFGNYVEVKHNRTYSTTYGHLSKYGRHIRKGVRIAQGEVIGYVGSTGLATGPHLDFRVKKNGKYINPLKLDAPSADPVPASERRDFYQLGHFYLAALNVIPSGEGRPTGGGSLVPALLAGARSGLLPLAPVAAEDQPAP